LLSTARQTDQQGKIKDPALQSGNQKAKQLLRPTSQSCFIPSEPMFNAVLNEKNKNIIGHFYSEIERG